MKKTDMELQAIREKLKRLESEAPTTGDAFNSPWSSPQRSSPQQDSLSNAVSSAAQLIKQANGLGQTSHSTAGPSPQAAAMATLRQRSVTQPTTQSDYPSQYSFDSENSAQTASKASNLDKANELVMQEIERLEIYAQNINELSAQQAHAILTMKRSAQQAAVALRRQGIHQHPQLEAITRFLDQYPSAMLPHLERDTQGRFSLSHTTVDLNYAEQEAIHTAQTLRNLTGHHTGDRTDEHKALLAQNSHPSSKQTSPKQFSTPIEAGPSLNDYLERSDQPSSTQLSSAQPNSTKPSSAKHKNTRRHRNEHSASRQSLTSGLTRLVHYFKNHQQRLLKQRILAGSVANPDIAFAPSNRSGSSRDEEFVYESASYKLSAEQLAQEHPSAVRRKRFSLLDSAIWFSAAAIVRIILEEMIVSYPVIRMPLMVILFVAISFSIYRVFVSKSSDSTPAFRLGMVLLGLFLGSSF